MLRANDDPGEDATTLSREASPELDPTTLVQSTPSPSPQSSTNEPKSPNDGEGLRHDELARARNFAGVSIIITAVGMIAQWTNVPRGWAGIAARITVLIVAVLAIVVWYHAAIKKTYPRRWMTAFGVSAVFCGVALQVDVGVFSPVVAVSVLCIAFFSRSRNTRTVVSLVSIYIVAFLVLAVLISLGVLRDRGAFSPSGVTTWQKLSLTIMIGTLLISALVHGRLSRRSAMEGLELTRLAALEAHRREAQLVEAQQDLERALRPVGRRGGRYTGQVADEWLIGPLIGRGGMGEVYAARHTASGKGAALKVLHADEVAEDASIEARFFREARIAMALRAPNLVEVFAIGLTSLGTPYIAMDLLRGNDLGWHLRREQRFPLPRLLAMAEQVAAGLDVAHEGGVVHRDLKPQNLFLAEGDASSSWKVLDFGVSTMETSQGTLTADGLVGTPGYMSPEQANGAAVTRRSDIFSFGSVLYRTLTGAPPFSGAGAPQLLYAVVHEMPVRPRDLVADLPVDVEAVLAIALAKDPNARFEAASALANALRAAATGTLSSRLRERAQRVLAKQPWRRLKSK